MTGNSELGMLVQIARWGLPVVPIGMNHTEKGMGMLYMDGDGIRFEPFDKTQEPMKATWEEFDAI